MSTATIIRAGVTGALRTSRQRATSLSGLGAREGLARAARTALLRSLACYVALTAALAVVLVAGRAPLPAEQAPAGGPAPSGEAAVEARGDAAPGRGAGHLPGLHELLARYGCSSTGLGAGVIPAAGVVRGRAGDVRVISFDRAWEIHTRGGPGDLVAVCRSAP